MDKWNEVASYILKEVNERTKIAWRKSKKEVLYGEIEYVLRMHGIKPTRERVFFVIDIVQMYLRNPELFYVSEDTKYITDAGIGKLLYYRFKDRSNPDDEVRKTLKVWLTSSLEDFLHSLNTLVRFNAKNNNIIALNELFNFCNFWENNQDQKIIAVSSGYYQEKNKFMNKDAQLGAKQ